MLLVSLPLTSPEILFLGGFIKLLNFLNLASFIQQGVSGDLEAILNAKGSNQGFIYGNIPEYPMEFHIVEKQGAGNLSSNPIEREDRIEIRATRYCGKKPSDGAYDEIREFSINRRTILITKKVLEIAFEDSSTIKNLVESLIKSSQLEVEDEITDWYPTMEESRAQLR